MILFWTPHLLYLILGSTRYCECQNSMETDVSYERTGETDSEKASSSESQEGLWSGWSEWSACSRTCDGGTAQQLRRCNGILGCSGDLVRYRLCNMQPCPDSSDFRELQCNSYNDIPYQGELMKWSAYHDSDEPCRLKCTSDTGVIATLSPSVKDGTRCKPGSLDLCVDGLCQTVGCDLMIGSDAKVDACGICGGDGSSCARSLYHWIVEPASLCSVTCGTGYKMSQVKCRNVVTGVDVREQFCDESLKPGIEVIKCNIHPCPAKWVAEAWNACSKTCGGGVRQRTVVCMQIINSTLSKVSETTCKGIKPKMVEPCSNIPCPPIWKASHWSECSVTCGEGVQIRNVTCKGEEGREHGNITCDESIRPGLFKPCSASLPCNSVYVDEMLDLDETLRILHPYPPFNPVAEKLVGKESDTSSLSSSEPSYKPEAWGECSVTCGEGFRERQVPCTVFLEGSRLLAKVPDLYCQSNKPTTTERCVQQPCSSPMTSRMDTGEDSYSDATYSDPYRSQYSETVKVAPHRTGKTYKWKSQGYTHCSASCLGGVQESLIMCVQEDDEKVVSPFLCSSETRPEALTRTCNLDPCPPRWNHSDFAPCSKPCGIGIQTREVHCIHELLRGGGGTVIVPNSKCPHPPPIDRQYCNILDCPVAWHTSDWSKCSKRCGGGVKERSVECKQVMAQNNVVPRPVSLCPKNKPPDKRPCNTKPCPSDEQRPSISSHSELYVQPPAKRKVSLKIGGSAQIYYGTQVKIKCPVKKFDRSKIQWAKDHKLVFPSKKYKISKKGALRIQNVNFDDTGVFTCLAGRSSADITINVRGKPGEYLSSEEMEKHTSNQLDPGMNEEDGRPHLMPGDSDSQEQRHTDLIGPGPEVSRLDRPKPDQPWPRQFIHSSTSSISDQAEYGFTTEEPFSEAPRSGASRILPHFHSLMAKIQI